MTKQEAIEILTEMRDWNDYITQSDALQMAIDALEQKPCTDAVSRQAVLDGLASIAKAKAKSDAQKSMMGRTMFFVEQLPAVSTEKTGRWEWVQYDGNPKIGNWHCSECNRIVCGAITAANPVYAYKYCPNCGAKMGVEE